MSAFSQRDGKIMSQVKKRNPEPELKRFMEKNQAIKTSLDKLGIFIIISLERLKENVGKPFNKVEIQPQEFIQTIKIGAE